MSKNPNIKWLSETRRDDLEMVGVKAANLGEMMRADFLVPAGFCITSHVYRDFIDANDLGRHVSEISASANLDDLSELDTITRQIRNFIIRGTVPATIYQEIGNAYMLLEQPRVAVRSSGRFEDMPQYSFAGQYETYLNINGIELLWLHIKKCWASQWTVQATHYRDCRSLDHTRSNFSAVVQEMVLADVAGVILTSNPVSGDECEVIISARWGLGEPVVNGTMTQDEFWVNKTNGLICKRNIAVKEQMVIGAIEGGTKLIQVPTVRQTCPCLTESHINKLMELANSIESFFGEPQDIEWALYENRLYVLQARPMIVRKKPTVAWESPVKGGRWVRTWRIGEWLSEPLSPLTKTLFIPILATAREKGGARHLGWKLPKGWHSKKPSYCVVNGYFFARADLDTLSFVLFLIRDIARIERTINNWRDIHLPAYIERLAGFRQFDVSRATSSELLLRIEELCRDAGEWWYLMALEGGGAGFMEKVFCIFCEKFIKDRNGYNPIIFLRGYDSKILEGERALCAVACEAANSRELRHILDEEDASEALSKLEVTSAGQKLLTKLRSYLQEYGHQIYSIDLLFPALVEEPSRLVPLLRCYLSGEARKPSENLAEQAMQREEAIEKTLRRLEGCPLRRRIFQLLRERVQSLIKRREDAVFFFQLGWPLMRKAILELGRRLVATGVISEVQDVFFLEKEELWRKARDLESGAMIERRIGELAKERRERWQWQRQLSPPDRIPKIGNSAWKRKGLKFWGEGKFHHGPTGTWLSGIGASPGQARGRARLLGSPVDFATLQKGDVLVTVALTPAWTPLFAIAAAVVVEAGGVTSHTSIVAREYGIPVVVGTGIATQVIKDGQTIRVDGSKGIIHFC